MLSKVGDLLLQWTGYLLPVFLSFDVFKGTFFSCIHYLCIMYLSTWRVRCDKTASNVLQLPANINCRAVWQESSQPFTFCANIVTRTTDRAYWFVSDSSSFVFTWYSCVVGSALLHCTLQYFRSWVWKIDKANPALVVFEIWECYLPSLYVLVLLTPGLKRRYKYRWRQSWSLLISRESKVLFSKSSNPWNEY